ncbi:MAG: hypothetical protein J5994_10875 [Ruminococcus sp.]|nr:hypothetical protein [Ruminococcus sp.]
MAKRNYNCGYKNFHYSVRTAEGASPPLPLPGAIKLSFVPQTSERSVLVRKRDGSISSFTEKAEETGKRAELEILSLPVYFLKDVLGYTQDENGVLIERTHPAVHVSLLYETKYGEERVRHELIDCVFSKPSFDVSTIAMTPAADTRKMDVILNRDPASGGYEKSISESDNAEIFNGWFNSVY